MKARTFKISKIRDAESMTVEATLSSEYPVRRFDGDEVLSHDPGAVDLSRAPLPVIVAHDGKQLPVGVAEEVRIEGKCLKSVIRFSKNASDIWSDVQGGILRNLSVGYQILERVKTKTGYVATKWMPYECSLVAAGADPAAGIGRKFEVKGDVKMDKNDLLKERKRATDSMIEMAGKADLSSEDKEKFDRIKEAVEGYDRRLEILEDVGKLKKDEFVPPDAGNKKRDLHFEGGPARDRSFKGMFGEPAYAEDEVRAFRTQLSGIPSGGGLSVPDPLQAKWLDDSLPEEVIRPRATIYPMDSQTLKIPGWDWSDMSSGECFGGFSLGFVSEGGSATAQTGKLRSIALNAYKGTIHCDISSELAEDGVGFVAHLESALKKSIAYGLDNIFFNGTAGTPTGVTNAASLITVPAEPGQVAEIDFQNIAKMYARQYAGGRKNCVWLCNDTLLPFLLTGLSVPIGTSGTWVNVFDSKNGEFRLLGKPVIFTPHLPAAKTANALMLVDLSQYAIGLRKNLRLERSNIPQWREDLLSYRLYIRVDGMDSWAAPYNPKIGDTQSWVVGLGAI